MSPPQTPQGQPPSTQEGPRDATGKGTLTGVVGYGRYRIVRPLGQGSFGAVYQAELLGPGGRKRQDVVLKLLHPHWAREAQVVARFQREFVATARIEHHNVARMIEHGLLEGDAPFLAMEFLEGRSLREEIKAAGAIPAERAVRLLIPVADALAEAHRLGVIHRDLKPENLFVVQERGGERDVPVLLDFGIARFVSESERITKTGAVLGTPYYMAPEQFHGDHDLGPPADIYALAVTAYEMLSGTLPFPGPGFAVLAFAHCEQAPPPLTHIPAALWRVLASCLEKLPARRPSAEQLAKALRALGDARPAPVPRVDAEAATLYLNLEGPRAAPPAALPAPGSPRSAARAEAAAPVLRGLEQAALVGPSGAAPQRGPASLRSWVAASKGQRAAVVLGCLAFAGALMAWLLSHR